MSDNNDFSQPLLQAVIEEKMMDLLKKWVQDNNRRLLIEFSVQFDKIFEANANIHLYRPDTMNKLFSDSMHFAKNKTLEAYEKMSKWICEYEAMKNSFNTKYVYKFSFSE